MNRALKVYSWTGTHASPGQRQSRNLVAARSLDEAIAQTSLTRTTWRWSGSITGNKQEIKTATARPGVEFWRPLDDRNGDNWQPIQPQEETTDGTP